MEEFETKLQKQFPLMYKDNVSVWVDEGWHKIVFELSNEIQKYIIATNSRRQWLIDNDKPFGELIEQVVVEQVKEKFGGLRFYYNGGDDYIAGMVSIAETWAENTCEVCGNRGVGRNLPWIKTLCDEHFVERKKRYENA